MTRASRCRLRPGARILSLNDLVRRLGKLRLHAPQRRPTPSAAPLLSIMQVTDAFVVRLPHLTLVGEWVVFRENVSILPRALLTGVQMYLVALHAPTTIPLPCSILLLVGQINDENEKYWVQGVTDWCKPRKISLMMMVYEAKAMCIVPAPP